MPLKAKAGCWNLVIIQQSHALQRRQQLSASNALPEGLCINVITSREHNNDCSWRHLDLAPTLHCGTVYELIPFPPPATKVKRISCLADTSLRSCMHDDGNMLVALLLPVKCSTREDVDRRADQCKADRIYFKTTEQET